MAKRKTASRPQDLQRHSSSVRVKSAPPKSDADHAYGVPVPEALHEAIENERDNLSKAESLLGCMAISMEYDSDPVTGPYYPDVARLARQLVKQSINALDSLTLQQILLRDKVKEELTVCCSFELLCAARSAVTGCAPITGLSMR